MTNHSFSIKTAALHFHQQETNTWCAATCAQMVLHYLSPNTDPIDQDILRTNIENRSRAIEPEIVWFGAPDGLAATLNAFSPALPGKRKRFQLVACRTESEVSRRIVWSLEHHNLPAIALVYGMKHWLVVRGYTANRPPTGPNDTGYQIFSFDLYDPWPPVPGPEGSPNRNPGHWPPPHTDGTDGCGSGRDRGIALNHISYDAWRSVGGILNSGYMTGVPADATGSKWKGRFLAIVGPSDGGLPSGGSEAASQEHEGLTPGDRARNLRRRISRHGAPRGGLNGLNAIEQDGRDIWKDTLAGLTPGQPQQVSALPPTVSAPRAPAALAGPESLSVTAMVRPDSVLPHAHYNIVPFEKPGHTPVAVRVDSATGAYLQLVAAKDDGQSVIQFVDLNEILTPLEGRQLDFEGSRVIFRRAEMQDEVTLGWKPCRESMSPFYPFYIVTLNTRSGTHEFYVRAHDGEIFTRLEENVAGG